MTQPPHTKDMTMHDWMDNAACRGTEAERLFPEGKGRTPKSVTDICRACPVRRECLTHALDSPWEPHGIWGGLAASVVQQLWRRNARRHYRTYAHETGLPA